VRKTVSSTGQTWDAFLYSKFFGTDGSGTGDASKTQLRLTGSYRRASQRCRPLAGIFLPLLPFLGVAHDQERARKSFRSRSPSRRSTSIAACVFFHIGTALVSNLRPCAVRIIRRPRRSAGSGVILTRPRRCRGLRAAVKVVRSMARRDATAVIPGGFGRFRDSSSENCPCVRPMGRSASSKRLASALAARCT
jgi:hypothetical protein